MAIIRRMVFWALAALIVLGGLAPVQAQAKAREAAMPPAGVNYVASHYDSGTLNSPVSWGNIDADFQILAQHYDLVRTYSMDLWNSLRVPRAAQRYGLRMAVGVGWAYNQDSDNANQLTLFKYVFGTYPELQPVVDYVIVGNEACVAGNQAAWQQWLAFRQQVADWVEQNWTGAKPVVTLSERDVVWDSTATGQCGGYLKANLPGGLPVFANIYPFWAGITVQEAVGGTSLNSLAGKWNTLVGNMQGRPVIIGETGWPTGGQPGTNPVTVTPTEADSAAYWSYVYQTFLTGYPNVGLLAFSAFDEPLKPSEGGSPDLAHHWGVYGSQRQAKAGMSFPKTVAVTPQAATGANVNLVVGGTYAPVMSNITVTTPKRTYTYDQWYAKPDGTAGYPWLLYNQSVTVNLPAAGGYPAASCGNTLTGGHGIGQPSDMNLTWGGSSGTQAPCNMINWASNGIWTP